MPTSPLTAHADPALSVSLPRRRQSSFFGSRPIVSPIPRAGEIAGRRPTPIDETLDTAFEHGRMIDGVRREFSNRTEEYLRRIEELTGQRLADPMAQVDREAIERGREMFAPAPEGETEEERRARVLAEREAAREARQAEIDPRSAFERNLRHWFDRAAELLREHGHEGEILSFDQVAGEIAGERRATQEARAFAELGETGVAAGLAGFAGEAAGAITHPLVAGSMLLGAPWSAGVLRFALTEAAIGATSEAMVQAMYQPSRELVGEEADWIEAALAVGMVGAAGGVLGGAIRGIPPAIRRLRGRELIEAAEQLPPTARTPDVEAALATMRRQVDIDEASPYGPGGTPLHRQRLDEAAQALATGRIPTGRAVDLDAAIPPADRAAVRELVELANDPNQAAALARIEQLRQLPREAIEQAESLSQFVERGGGITREDAARFGISADHPAVVRQGGRTVEEVADAAAEAGFPVRPGDPEDFATALRTDQAADIPIERATVADLPAEVAALARQRNVLDRLGIDAGTLEPGQTAARVRALQRPVDAPEPARAVDAETGQVVERSAADGPEARNRQAARTEDARATAATERQAELDAARERAFGALPEDARVRVEDPATGELRTMTKRELNELNAREAEELFALNVCLRGA